MATMKKKSAKAAPKKTMMKRPSAKKAQQPAPQQAPPVPTQQTPQPPMGTPAPGTNGPMMRKGGTIKKKAKAGFDLNKDGKTTFKDVLIGRGVLPKNAKSGAKMKKAQNSSIMRPVGLNIGSAIQDMQQLRKERMDREKAKENNTTPSSTTPSKRPNSNMSNPYPTSGVSSATLAKSGKTVKKAKAKSGGSMKKCRYGCK